MAQKNMNPNITKSQKPRQERSGSQPVRGSELRGKMTESLEKGEEFRRANQGADQIKSEVNRSSSDRHKDTGSRNKVP